MKVGIIGCGLIGRKRIRALQELVAKNKCDMTVVACTDAMPSRSEAMSRDFPNFPIIVYPDWLSLLQVKEIDAVFIATTHDVLCKVTQAALEMKKHVFVEKPAARSAEELSLLLPIAKAARANGVCVHVGFNHRYHPAIRKARDLVDCGEIGPLMYVRGRYGHGGRRGYEKEWRANPMLSGGGELIDQGIHLIDLAQWFLGKSSVVKGMSHRFFWDMPVEDNGFVYLRTQDGKVAWLHASCTEWKNLFSFEIYGRLGKLEISGLGGSYGTEQLTYYRMLPEMGPPLTRSWVYSEDDSWTTECLDFYDSIQKRKQTGSTLEVAHSNLKVIEAIYRDGEVL